jgi:hypothetical protein
VPADAGRALILTVEALEQTLLHDADRARNPQQQAELMAQRGQLHAFAGHFADRMLDAVADALRGCANRSAVPVPVLGRRRCRACSGCRWSMSTKWIATCC